MSRWAARLTVLVGVVFAIAIVGLGSAGGYLYWQRVETNGEQQTRAELPPLAVVQIPAILGYDFQTIARSSADAARLMAPDFRRKYEGQTAQNIIPQARDRQMVSQVNVVGVGMLAAQRNSGSVMVFMNRTMTDKSKQPLYEGSRLRVDYQRIDGDWRISDITPM